LDKTTVVYNLKSSDQILTQLIHSLIYLHQATAYIITTEERERG